MYSTKTATTNTGNTGTWMPVGINENVTLGNCEVLTSPQGKEYIRFEFVNSQGQIVHMTEWKNEKNMWIKTDEDLQARDDQQFGRILQILNSLTDSLPEVEFSSFSEMIHWVAQIAKQYIPTKKSLRLKVIYDNKGYTKVSNYGVFVEPMDVEETQIKLFKRDLLERPIVADKEPAADPFGAPTEPTSDNLSNNTGADDLPF
jgi:hypothetical protein